MSRAEVPPSRRPAVRLRRAAWRWRHLLGALCLALAASAAVAEVRPAPPPTEPAVVLAADLPAGHVLTERDLRVSDLPPRALPRTHLTDVSDAVGSPLAVGLPRGSVLTSGMLAGSTLAAGAPPGEVVVAVRIADDGSAALAEPGLRVSLVAPAADGGPAAVVAEDVLVLARAAEREAGLLGGGGSEITQIIVSTTAEAANVIVGSSAWTALSVVLGPA